MFQDLPGQWTPVIPLVELTTNPQAVELAGERLVLFRDAADRWHALADRCPHRSASLSRGTVTRDGHLQCGYHGWTFGGDGACQRVPLNDLNERALAKLTAQAFPTREIAGAIWIYTGVISPGTGTPPEPELPDALRGPARNYGTYVQDWDAHWTRALENFIDFAHPPWVHADTIGAFSRPAVEAGITARVEVEPTPWGFIARNFFGDRRQGFRLDWYRPNLVVLHFGAGDTGKLCVTTIPVNDRQTRVMTVRRLPPGMDGSDYAARSLNGDHTILDEDRAIVESQPPGPVPDEGEASVATDAPTVFFRRWYRDLLAGAPAILSAAPAPHARR